MNQDPVSFDETNQLEGVISPSLDVIHPPKDVISPSEDLRSPSKVLHIDSTVSRLFLRIIL